LTRSHVEGAEGVIAAAESGDVAARQILVTAATAVGSVLGLLVGVLDPHALVIGGGLGSAAGVFWESLQSAIRAHIWSNHQRQLPIAQGKFGPMAGLIGAGLAALDRFPQEPA
jgi:glucokinase